MRDLTGKEKNGGLVTSSKEAEEDSEASRAVFQFLSKLSHVEFVLLATTNDLFDASIVESADHFLISVKCPFIHQTIAIERNYWRDFFRPKLERDFVVKMVTADPELNIFGLPSAMTVPDAIQRRATKRDKSKGEEPPQKVPLQPGTYVVSATGVQLVMDRACFPGLASSSKGESSRMPHLLIPCPSATIDTLFSPHSLPPSQNGSRKASSEDEEAPSLDVAAPAEREEGEGRKGNGLGEDRNERMDEGMDQGESAEMPSLAPQQTPTPKKAARVEPKKAAKGEKPVTLATILGGIGGSEKKKNEEEAKKKEEEEKKKEEEAKNEAQIRDTRSLSASSSKKTPWKDWVEEPKNSKRVSLPSKRRLSPVKENDQASKPKRASKERSQSLSDGSDETPPPLLERQDPTEEPVVKKAKAKTTARTTRSSMHEESPERPSVVSKDSTSSLVQSNRSRPATRLVSPITIRVSRSQAEKNAQNQTGQSPPSLSTAPNETSRKEVRRQDEPPVIKQEPSTAPVLRPKKKKEEVKTEEPVGTASGESAVKEEEAEESATWVNREPAEPIQAEYHNEPEIPRPGMQTVVIDMRVGRSNPHHDEHWALLMRIDRMKKHAETQSGILEKEKQDTMMADVGGPSVQGPLVPLKGPEPKGGSAKGKKATSGPVLPLYQTERTDPMHLYMLIVHEKTKQGRFYTESTAHFYEECQAFYKALMKPEPCREWERRTVVGPGIDGLVYHTSGHSLLIGSGINSTEKMNLLPLPDLHNHREFRLGDIVWAKFGREFWPGYIKAFTPARYFDEYKGDAVMVQWLGEVEEHTHSCYGDVYRFDLYFAIMYSPTRSDKSYSLSIARAISIDGRPGYWEDYISRAVYDEMVRMGGNVTSIPKQHMERIKKNEKGKNLTPAQFTKTLAIINQKEINHFQFQYKAIYKKRNHAKFTPNVTQCMRALNLHVEGPSAPRVYLEDDLVDDIEEEDEMPGPSCGKKMPPIRVYQGGPHVPEESNHSAEPLFANELIEVVLVNGKHKEVHYLYNDASSSPIDKRLHDANPAPVGEHQQLHYDRLATKKMAEWLRKKNEKRLAAERAAELAADNGEGGEEEEELRSSTDDPGLPRFLVTCHETIYLTRQKQTTVNEEKVKGDPEWAANTRKCEEHVAKERAAKERALAEKIKRDLEQQKIDQEKKAAALREKEERAAARKARNGPLVPPLVVQAPPKKPPAGRSTRSSGQ